MNRSITESSSESRKSAKIAVFYVAMVIVALLWFTPVFTLIVTALKDAGDFAVNGAFSFPKGIRWANFSEAWETGVKNYFWNSVIVTVFKVPAGIILESMAAFALTHMHFKWADRVFTYILIGLIVPMQMTLVPLTLLMNALNLIDTLAGLTILYIGFGVPFGVLVMRGFFRTVPTAIIEAARIDGCSWFRIFYRIALPLAIPAVVSLCILDGVATWNEFILAQIFLRSDENRTLPLGLVQFSTQFATQYDQLAAAVLISVVPIVLVFLFFQRYFVSGMGGAVK
ncbi:MAG: carbohydrate ABC transporter permease [Verrucomicrobia bacterium]|nr:carbohydrate ABC transporter permease [Verrucomicrobiota bacterium]